MSERLEDVRVRGGWLSSSELVFEDSVERRDETDLL
jgi:hypothetical protein